MKCKTEVIITIIRRKKEFQAETGAKLKEINILFDFAEDSSESGSYLESPPTAPRTALAVHRITVPRF